MANIDFTGRTAIVTGAGGGLGRTYAMDLASRGANVVVNDLGCRFDGEGASHSMADAVVDEIKAAGGNAIASYDSVATPEGGEAIVSRAMEAFGRIDVLINNAGTLRNADVDVLPDDIIDEMIGVHLKGAFYVTRPAYRVMKEQQYGRVVFASSASGMLGNWQQAAYGAAKAGLVGLMNVLSLEGVPFNVKCNALLPTAQTRMEAAMDPAMMEKSAAVFTELVGPHMGNTMEQRFVTPLVTYLASEACDSTHAIYSATLGRYARVFVGVCKGWAGPRDNPATAEDIAAHFGQICDQQGYTVPDNLVHEFEIIGRQLG